MSKSIMLEIQQLGDKLVICIPAELARIEKLSPDNPWQYSFFQKMTQPRLLWSKNLRSTIQANSAGKPWPRQ